jgi:hypothetical protein
MICTKSDNDPWRGMFCRCEECDPDRYLDWGGRDRPLTKEEIRLWEKWTDGLKESMIALKDAEVAKLWEEKDDTGRKESDGSIGKGRRK